MATLRIGKREVIIIALGIAALFAGSFLPDIIGRWF